VARDQAIDLLNALVVGADGQRWGERASELQRADARALLDPDGPRRHWIGRPRGYSKTDDLAAVMIVALLERLQGGDEAVAVAADREQAGILVRRIKWIAARTPELGSALNVERYAVTTSGGARLEAMASDAAGSWGRTPAWAVADELGQWARSPSAQELWMAISSAVAKVPKGVLAIISTAGEPDHWSRGVYENAVEDPLWHVSEIHTPAPWLDAGDIEGERRRLPESIFSRLWENRWASGEDTLLKYEDVVQCACLPGALDPEVGVRYIVGADLAVRRDRAVVAVCHAEQLEDDQGKPDGVRVVCDQLDVFRATHGQDIDLQQVQDTVLARARSYNHAPTIFDPAQAHQMMQALRREGLQVQEHVFSATSNSKRALVILELVRGHRLWLPDEQELIGEFAALRLVQRGPGLFRYDHMAGKHDDQVTAIGLCAHHLLERPTRSASLPDLARSPSRWAPTSATPLGTPSRGRAEAPVEVEKAPAEEPEKAPASWVQAYGGDEALALAEYRRSLAAERKASEARAKQAAPAPRAVSRFARSNLEHPGLRR
jgi:hypothetical protein